MKIVTSAATDSRGSPKAFLRRFQVPEHTWGVDIKATIADYANWSNKQFHDLLASRAQNFENAVVSWQRQARYVDWALEALGLSPEVGPPSSAARTRLAAPRLL